jgi:diguanylate cyclase (GGDEF)-like protein
LTAAFLIVVLGPVLLGAVFIGSAVSTVASGRAADRLDSAAAAVRSTVAAGCDRLTSTADAVALLYGKSAQLGSAARRVVDADKAAAVRVTDHHGTVLAEAGDRPPAKDVSARCGNADPADRGVVGALAARVTVRDSSGAERGTVDVWTAVDSSFVDRLARAAGRVDVTVDDTRRVPLSSFPRAKLATESLAAARGSQPAETASTGRYVRELAADRTSPIPLVLATQAPRMFSLYAMLIGIVVVAAALAVGAAAWLARSTTRPLAELARGADAVASGDLGARVAVHGNDELAGVARTFNRMARETEGYVSALTASRDQLRGQLALLGETLSSTLDLDRILEVIVDTAMAVTSARAGVMVLVDPDEPEVLYGRAGDGLPDGLPVSEIRVRLGEGLLGRVAADGQPRCGRVGSGGEAIAPTTDEPSCTTYLAVPVRAVTGHPVEDPDLAPSPGALLGVLAIYDRLGGDDFDDTDVSTLRTFAGQAAVAVSNVLSHREAQRLSLTDPLTGLWNYRYLQVSLAREVERAGRFHRQAAVIAIDLDRFKTVNDTFGHPAGDAVLAELSGRLTSVIREVDLAFRYGGEEFVVLLPEADVDGASRVAARLAAAVRDAPMTIPASASGEETTVDVTVSLGVAVFPEHGEDGAAVLSAADEALYAAKAAGRDTWRVATTHSAMPTDLQVFLTFGPLGSQHARKR